VEVGVAVAVVVVAKSILFGVGAGVSAAVVVVVKVGVEVGVVAAVVLVVEVGAVGRGREGGAKEKVGGGGVEMEVVAAAPRGRRNCADEYLIVPVLAVAEGAIPYCCWIRSIWAERTGLARVCWYSDAPMPVEIVGLGCVDDEGAAELELPEFAGGSGGWDGEDAGEDAGAGCLEEVPTTSACFFASSVSFSKKSTQRSAKLAPPNVAGSISLISSRPLSNGDRSEATRMSPPSPSFRLLSTRAISSC
jgi:hypothetical protein